MHAQFSSTYSFNKSRLFTFLAYKVAASNMLSNHEMKKKIYNIEYYVTMKWRRKGVDEE